MEILAESFFSRELLLTACFNRKERTCTAFDLLGPLVDQLGVKVREEGVNYKEKIKKGKLRKHFVFV